MMRLPLIGGVLLASASLAGCAHRFTPPQITYDEAPKAAVLEPDPPKPVTVVAVPQPLPLPGQLKPLPGPTRAAAPEPSDPRARVDAANGAARIEPTRAGYINAVQVYPFSDGALYQLYAAPGQITDIALEPGEQLTGTGPVAAGDTVRWIIGDTESGSGPTSRQRGIAGVHRRSPSLEETRARPEATPTLPRDRARLTASWPS